MGKVTDILTRRRQNAERSRDKRVKDFMDRHPDLALLMDKRRKMAAELVRASITADSKNLEELRAQLAKLDKIEDIELGKAGLDRSFFKADYYCKKCNDSGFVDGISCSCRDRLLLDIRYDMSSIASRIREENFDSFNLDLFRKNRQAGEDISPYENMKEIKRLFQEDYVSYFNPNPPAATPNVYLYGEVGTGKTFLLNCIVKDLLDAGYKVFYQTASEIFEFLVSFSFTYEAMKAEDERAKFDFIRECDLLVIDDLGSEYQTEKMISEFFALLNDRMIRQKPMIFSSNLPLDELVDFYNSRIASRIRGEFITYKFFGPDLRLSDRRS